MRTLYLPATRKTISLRAYLDGYAMVKANPTMTFTHGLTCWWSCTGAEVLEQYRREMNAVINRRGGEDWRNERTERDIAYYRDARKANTPRLFIRSFEIRKLNKRFAHLLSTDDDF